MTGHWWDLEPPAAGGGGGGGGLIAYFACILNIRITSLIRIYFPVPIVFLYPGLTVVAADALQATNSMPLLALYDPGELEALEYIEHIHQYDQPS